MSPIRRVVFLGDDGKPIPPAPSRLTPLEDEVQGGQAQDELVEFGESRAPAPAAASVHHTILPAPVGAAQELTRLRHSNELREASEPRRRRASRRRSASRPRTARRTSARRPTSARTRRTGRASRTARTTRTRRASRPKGAGRTRTVRRTRRTAASSRRR
jgi:hypothetical protein